MMGAWVTCTAPQAPGGLVFLWERRVQPPRGNCCFSLCSCPSNIRDFLKLLKWPCQLAHLPSRPEGPKKTEVFCLEDGNLPTHCLRVRARWLGVGRCQFCLLGQPGAQRHWHSLRSWPAWRATPRSPDLTKASRMLCPGSCLLQSSQHQGDSCPFFNS